MKLYKLAIWQAWLSGMNFGLTIAAVIMLKWDTVVVCGLVSILLGVWAMQNAREASA